MKWFLWVFTIAVGVIVADAAPVLLRTSLGVVVGTENDGVEVFRGVPYAAAPVGALRFRPPQAHRGWTGTRPATAEAPACPQGVALTLPWPFGAYNLTEGQEDCLYLDIYRPAGTTNVSSLPVMIWIYGGGFLYGNSYQSGWYDATSMVQARDHVHVAMNYRLGVFGFAALNELLAESGTTGNYGLQDQRAAMQWVRDNLIELGGDSKRVTIFGESAGGMSVCYHLVSPASRGLFTRAIVESGPCASHAQWRKLEYQDMFARHYFNSVGCTGSGRALVDCIRAVPMKALTGGNTKTPHGFGNGTFPTFSHTVFGPTIDGRPLGLLGVPADLIRSGNASVLNRVPLLIGSNKDEANVFLYVAFPLAGFSLPLNRASFDKVLASTFVAPPGALQHSLSDSVIQYYSAKRGFTPSDFDGIYNRAATEGVFACPSRNIAALWQAPTYLYEFTFTSPWWPDTELLGAYHTSEVGFVFGNLHFPPLLHTVISSRATTMSKTMMAYWLTFADGATPRGVVPWPTFNATEHVHMRLDNPATQRDDYPAQSCAVLWDHVIS